MAHNHSFKRHFDHFHRRGSQEDAQATEFPSGERRGSQDGQMSNEPWKEQGQQWEQQGQGQQYGQQEQGQWVQQGQQGQGQWVQQRQQGQQGEQGQQGQGQVTEGNVHIDPSKKPEEKEQDDLPLLLKRMEQCCNQGGDPNRLMEDWIAQKEKKLKRWRKGIRSGAGVQTFGVGLVTFGLGPIPINMSLMASLNKHIVHVFTLDDQRVDHFVKSTLGYGAGATAKKLGALVAKSAMQTGAASTAGFVPLIGPAVSATMTAHRISKVGKETTAKCAELVREICRDAVNSRNFNI